MWNRVDYDKLVCVDRLVFGTPTPGPKPLGPPADKKKKSKKKGKNK